MTNIRIAAFTQTQKSIKISQTESQPYNGEGSESWFRFNQQPTKNSRYIYRMQNMIWEEIKRIITVNNKTSDCLFAINPYFSHYGGGGQYTNQITTTIFYSVQGLFLFSSACKLLPCLLSLFQTQSVNCWVG